MKSKKDSEEGELIRNIIKEGKIVPVKITCGLIKKNMDLNGRV
jgi:adenylate kinase family enzyme